VSIIPVGSRSEPIEESLDDGQTGIAASAWRPHRRLFSINAILRTIRGVEMRIALEHWMIS